MTRPTSESSSAASLRVLVATDFPFPGATGSPLHCMTIVEGLVQRGAQVDVLKYEGKSKREWERNQWNGVHVDKVPRRRWFSVLRELRRYRRPDVVYAHGFVSAAVLMPLLLTTRIPLVLEVHSFSDLEREETMRMRLRRTILHVLPRMARTEVIALSHSEADDIVAARVAAMDRVTVSYPPIDVESYVRPVRAVRTEAPTILYVGNFMPYQGIDLLLDAASRVVEHRPDVCVRVVGGSDEDVEIRRASLSPSVARNVEIVGRVPPEDTAALYDDADIVVIPRPDHRINRTTARKLGEYLAAGRLIVATDVADHRLLLEGNEAGIVSDTTGEDFGRALCSALDLGEQVAPMIEAAQNLARDEFGIDVGLSARIEVLRRAVRKSRPSPR